MEDRALEEREQEIERLTKQLDHMEQELLEKYCDVGRFVLEKLERENKEIDQLTDQVIKVKKELVKVKGEIRCPYCYQYNEPESIYCNRCGKKLEKKKREVADD
ncbi:MAG: zinc ribbon domain-containing protein [Eubacteriales bacterium]|nr:zinc ribbon domain-containing protein [Eubacteriales bacterium]